MTTLDEIQARADAATEGPWEVDRNYPFSSDLVGIFATDAKNYVLKATDDLDDYPVTSGDATFIAHAREDVPKLVAAIRDVEAVHHVAQYKTLIGPYCAGCTSPIDGGPELWPCATLRAITEALG